jgi:hypothetical protein
MKFLKRKSKIYLIVPNFFSFSWEKLTKIDNAMTISEIFKLTKGNVTNL